MKTFVLSVRVFDDAQDCYADNYFSERMCSVTVNADTSLSELKMLLYQVIFEYHPSQYKIVLGVVDVYMQLTDGCGVDYTNINTSSLQSQGITTNSKLECRLLMEHNVYSMRARILKLRNRTATTFLYAQHCLKQEQSKQLPNELQQIIGRYCSSI